MKRAGLVLLYVVSVVASAVLATYMTTRRDIAHFAVELDATQAMLNFNHRRSYGELEAYATKGCYPEALEMVRMHKALETEQLSSFLKRHPNTWVTKYVSDREPTLITELVNYKNPYGTTWPVPKCDK